MIDHLEDTERWFLRQGLPYAISGYSATEDVLTRASPFLGLVLFVEVFSSFDDRFGGWSQAAAFVGGIAILIAGFVVVNRLRGRPSLQLPDDVGPIEIAAFVLVPAVLPALFSDEGLDRSLILVLLNVAVVGIAYVVTAYGILPALRVGARQAAHQFRTVTQLLARGLPLLLLITTFVFLNAEMWQVAHDFEPAYFAILVALLLSLTFGFLGLRLPREIDALAHFESWDEVCRLAASTSAPLSAPSAGSLAGRPGNEALGRVDRVSIGLLLTISQAVQVILLGTIVGAFYVAFGVFAVREETILQWTTADRLDELARLPLLGGEIVLTWELLAVSSFVACFSMLQFAVASVTDTTYREEFYEDVTRDTRAVLAVRSLYLALVTNGPAAP